MSIGDFFINGYWWFLLLMAIGDFVSMAFGGFMSMAFGGYSINGYW
jgi:hypothetical protein